MLKEITYTVGKIAEMARVHSVTMKKHLKDSGLINKCPTSYGRIRVPISVARELLGLPVDAALPQVPKKPRKKKVKRHLTMSDVEKARKGGTVFNYEP